MSDSEFSLKKGKVVIDIGGDRFRTTVSTLQNVPNTRLGRLVSGEDSAIWSQETELFFDRNSFLFEYILDFYRTGELHLPQNRCGKAIKAELEFWGMSDADISSCCWKTFTDSTEVVVTQMKIEKEFEALCQQKSLSLLDKSVKAKVWAFLTYPKSSTAAQAYSVISNILVTLSLLVIMIGTVANFRVDVSGPKSKAEGNNTTFSSRVNLSGETELLRFHATTGPHPGITYSDFILVVFIFTEFCIRVIVCPDKKAFLTSFAAFADVVYFIPIFALQFVGWIDQTVWRKGGNSYMFLALQVFVAFRVLRLHRVASCIHGFNVLTLALRASLKELLLLVSLTLFAAVIFAFAIFYVEMSSQDSFSNAFYGIWWALITMTSVGYGDFYPTSPVGYVLGVLCAFVGLILISLPVPMVAHNFNLYYAYRARGVYDKAPVCHGKKRVELTSASNISDKTNHEVKA